MEARSTVENSVQTRFQACSYDHGCEHPISSKSTSMHTFNIASPIASVQPPLVINIATTTIWSCSHVSPQHYFLKAGHLPSRPIADSASSFAPIMVFESLSSPDSLFGTYSALALSLIFLPLPCCSSSSSSPDPAFPPFPSGSFPLPFARRLLLADALLAAIFRGLSTLAAAAAVALLVP